MKSIVPRSSTSRMAVVLAVSTMLVLPGCVTSNARMQYGDKTDMCSAQREPLLQLTDDFNQPIAQGAVVGALLGGLAAAVLANNTGSGAITAGKVLAGVAIGGLTGASAGYLKAKQNEANTREELLASVDADAGSYRSRSSSLRNAVAQLQDCRRGQIQQVRTQFESGAITREQASARLDEVQALMTADDGLLNTAMGTADKRVSEIADARAAAAGFNNTDAYLGDVAGWQPEIQWNDPRQASGQSTVYSTGSLNVRSTPSRSGDRIASLGKGEAVTALGSAGRGGEWTEVRTSDGRKGFVLGRLLSGAAPVTDIAAAPVANTPIETVNAAADATTQTASAARVSNRPDALDETKAMVVQQRETRALTDYDVQQTVEELAMVRDLLS